MNRTTALFLFSLWLMQATSAFGDPAVWIAPQDLGDNNTTVSFEVDSTWHLVEGTTSRVTGKVWLLNPEDPLSIQAEIHVPVVKFDTHNSMRDDKMRDVMAAAKFPEVIIRTNAVKGDCSPQTVETKGFCDGALLGSLTIRDVTQEVTLPYTIKREHDSFVISGKYSFEWAKYHVEDPSILIAKLSPVVSVNYSCHLPVRAE